MLDFLILIACEAISWPVGRIGKIPTIIRIALCIIGAIFNKHLSSILILDTGWKLPSFPSFSIRIGNWVLCCAQHRETFLIDASLALLMGIVTFMWLEPLVKVALKSQEHKL